AAVTAATAKAAELAGKQDALQKAITDPDTAILFQRVLQMGIDHSDLDRIANLRADPNVTLQKVIDEFLEAKKAAQGRSSRNLKTLTSHTGLLTTYFGDDRVMATITPDELEAWMMHVFPGSPDNTPTPRTRRNRRGSAVTLWRWARKRQLIPDETTAAELTERPIAKRKVPETWTPAELGKMLKACPESHLPWLTFAAFAGLREAELYQEGDDEKDPIRWSDLDLKKRLIRIRPETDKNGYRRIVPINDTLLNWIKSFIPSPLDKDAHVCQGRRAYREIKGLNQSVTSLLGAEVGGWRQNALRHSWISYRVPIVGLSQTATEAGNSESEARRSYNDAKSQEEAEQWFSLNPSELIGTEIAANT
ncbi:MAG: hypothetical protein AAGF67_14165, partial [Verrucomicrobiota bacterium]